MLLIHSNSNLWLESLNLSGAQRMGTLLLFREFSNPFYKLMNKEGISDKSARIILQYMNMHFETCRMCGKTPCKHNPGPRDMKQLNDTFSAVPVLKCNGVVVRHAYIFPLVSLYHLMLDVPEILQSLVFEPDSTVPFTLGSAFSHVHKWSHDHNVKPLCIALYTDKATVVRVGQRSLWPIYMRIVNSRLSHTSVTRVVGLIPILASEDLPGVSKQNLTNFRVAIYQVVMAAVCHSGLMYHSQESFCFGGCVYRCICSMTAADSKDHYKASGMKEGDCFRCFKTSNGEEQLFSERFCSIVGQIQHEGAGKKVLRAERLEVAENFTIDLSFFDLSLHAGICLLHLHTLWTGKIVKWLGVLASNLSVRRGAGRPSRSASATLLQEVRTLSLKVARN